MKKKIAIACQGGGSQTAFTAGVLKSFFDSDKFKRDIKLTGISGTSGGAICALITWYSIHDTSKEMTASERLVKFWEENSTQSYMEDLANITSLFLADLFDMGFPMPRFSPYSPNWKMNENLLPFLFQRKSYYDLKTLLKNHIQFDKISSFSESKDPVLIIGAADVNSGEFKKFSSSEKEITIDSVLASCAIPQIFQAVEVKGKFYWDGLFSENPPVNELLHKNYIGENIPEEVWVIQINPEIREKVPESLDDIIDRRNEMIGNQSLKHELDNIPYEIIPMPKELSESLKYTSKVNRSNKHIKELMAAGENEGKSFLQNLP